MGRIKGREETEKIFTDDSVSKTRLVGALFRQLGTSEGDTRELQARLNQLRSDIRLGHTAAERDLKELIDHLNVITANPSRSIDACILQAQALSLYGSVLQNQGVSDSAKEILEQAVVQFDTLIGLLTTEDGQFYADYGNALALLGRKDKACQMLTRAYEADSKVAGVAKTLGLLLKEKGEIDRAEQLLEEAASATPEASLLRNLAEVFEKTGKPEKAAKAYREAGYLFCDKEQFAKGLECFDNSLRLDPTNTQVLFASGEAARLSGRLEDAVRYYETNLQQNRDHALTWLSLSSVLLQLQHYKQAIEAADQAYKLNVQQPEMATIIRSEALEALGRVPEAEKCLDEELSGTPSNLSLLYAKGDLLLRNGKLENLLPAISRALAENPRSEELMHLQGRSLRFLGKLRESIHVLREATGIFHDSARLRFELALALRETGDGDAALNEIEILIVRAPNLRVAWVLKAEILEERQKWDTALDALDQGIRLEGPNNDLLAVKGRLLVRLGRFAEAAAILKEIVEVEPHRDNEWIELINAQLMDNQLEAATRSVNRALELKPKSPQYLLLHGLVLAGQGRTDEAIAEIRNALENDKEYFFARNTLIDLLVGKGWFGEALQEIEAAAKLQPEDPAVLVKKAEVLRALQRYPEALAVAGTVVQKHRDNAPALAEKAWALWMMSNNQPALEAISQALDRDPKPAELWGVKGGILRDLGREDEALAAFQNAIDRLPGYTFALLESARILRGKGETPKALALLEQILQREPAYRPALLEKALCLSADDPDHRIRALEELMDQAPDFKEALAELGDAYRLSGQYEAALRRLNQALKLDKGYWYAAAIKGQVLIAQEKWPEGVDTLQEALRHDSTLEWALADLGVGLRMLQRNKEALEVLDKALLKYPDNVGALSDKAWVLIDVNRPLEAVEILSGLIKKFTTKQPIQSYYHAQLGMALQQADKFEEAQHAIGDALDLDPENGFALGVKSQVLAEVGLFAEAADCALEATKFLKEAWVFSALGWAYENDGSGQPEEALTAYEEAIKLDPKDLWSVKGKANSLRLLGRKAEARETYRQVIRSASALGEKSGKYNSSVLGWCYYNLGEYDEAIRLYLSSVTPASNQPSDQYDIALSLLCAGRYTLALDRYRKATDGLFTKYIGRQKGILHVALFDLHEALSDPDITKADSAIAEVTKSFQLLLQRFHEIGGTENLSLPAPKRR